MGFPIGYHVDVPVFDEELQTEVENHLIDLARDHTDLIGAAVALTKAMKAHLALGHKSRCGKLI